MEEIGSVTPTPELWYLQYQILEITQYDQIIYLKVKFKQSLETP